LSWKELSVSTREFIVARGLSAFSLGIVIILLNLYFLAIGFDEEFLGLSFALFGLGTALSSIPAGYFSDYAGSLSTMIFGEIIMGFGLVSQISFSDRDLILVAGLVTGIGTSFIAVARQPYVSHISTSKNRHSLFSYSYAVFLVMTVVGNVFGGLARKLAPSDLLATSYRSILVIAAFLNLLSAFVLYLSKLGEQRKENSKSGNQIDKEKSDKDIEVDNSNVENINTKTSAADLIHVPSYDVESSGSLWSNVLKFGLVRFIIGIGSGLSIPFLNIYFKNRFDLSTMVIGFIFGIGSLFTAFIVLKGPKASRKKGIVNVIVLFQLAALPFLVVLSVTQWLMLAIVAFWIRGALMKTATPLFKAVVMNMIPKEYRGRAASITVTLWHLGRSTGAYFGGKLIVQSGFFIPFVTTALLYGSAALLFYLLFSPPQKR